MFIPIDIKRIMTHIVMELAVTTIVSKTGVSKGEAQDLLKDYKVKTINGELQLRKRTKKARWRTLDSFIETNCRYPHHVKEVTLSPLVPPTFCMYPVIPNF
jgi:hypothetical protein